MASPRRWRSGATALEFALLAPALVLLVLGAVDVSQMLWTQSALDLSVETAARYYALNTGLSASQIAQYAAGVTPQLRFPASTFAPTTAAEGSATCYQVGASYVFAFNPQGVLPLKPILKAKACYA